jgi:hypothetical protein
MSRTPIDLVHPRKPRRRPIRRDVRPTREWLEPRLDRRLAPADHPAGPVPGRVRTYAT